MNDMQRLLKNVCTRVLNVFTVCMPSAQDFTPDTGAVRQQYYRPTVGGVFTQAFPLAQQE